MSAEMMRMYGQMAGMTDQNIEEWVSLCASNEPGMRDRYCLNCDCFQRTREDVPCWQCGNEKLSTERPAYAQSLTGHPVRGGDIWGPEEMECFQDTQREAA